MQDKTLPYSSWQAWKIYLDTRKILSEKDTSFLDCKHKHMMKSGAPPDKVGVLYCMVTYRIPWFHKQN